MWIVVGVVVLAIVILTVALAALAGRLRPLARAVRRLSLRAEQAEKLQAKVVVMQERLEALQDLAEQTAARREASGTPR